MADMSELESKLMAQIVYSEEEAYISYSTYAAACGFTVHKGNQYYFRGTKRIRSKTYCCSNKAQTRTGCGAMISYICDGSGRWNVSRFVKEHNHATTLPHTDPPQDNHPSTRVTQSLVLTASCASSSSATGGSHVQPSRSGRLPKQKRVQTILTNTARESLLLNVTISTRLTTSTPHLLPIDKSYSHAFPVLFVRPSNVRRRRGRPSKESAATSYSHISPNEASVLPAAPNCIHKKCKCKRFYLEPLGLCCSDGKVCLKSYPMPVEEHHLLTGLDAASVNFRRNIRTYNNNFAFTSLGVKYDHELTKNLKGMYTFRVQGQFYHFLPPLDRTGLPASEIQMYYYDSHAEVSERCLADGKLLPSVATVIQRILMENPYTRFFKQLYADPLPSSCKIVLNGNPLLDQRVYNLPTGDQIAAILSESDDMSVDRTPHIRVQTTSGSSQVVKQIYGCCDPLQYPILFPYGESGWHPSIRKFEGDTDDDSTVEAVASSTAGNQVQRNRAPVNLDSIPDAETLLQHEDEACTTTHDPRDFITMRQYYSYKLQMRDTDESILLHSLRLLQQFVVNVYVKIETKRLDHIRFSQREYRTELRAGIVDAVATGDSLGGNVGRKSILPASFIGGPRDMRKRYFDAMALVQKYGKPDIFLTMTCNPKWSEIRDNLKWHETPFDRPDLLSRVFRAKLEVVKKEILKKRLFGEVESCVYVVEFQKRGMPHAHFLIILKGNYKPLTPEAYDRLVCAEIPDESEFPHLHRLVIKHMIHGPCGAMNKNHVCMRNGVCKDNPKQFTPYTVHTQDAYPIYRRRNDGRKVFVLGKELDNRWVVPYNPHLLATFDCHFNVEVYSSVCLVKYMYKYIYKGLPMVNFSVALSDGESCTDEIRNYQQARWLGPPEATWRIYGFPLSEITPAVYTLQIHLQDNQVISFRRNNNLQVLVDDPLFSKTMLTEFFYMNSKPQVQALQLLYKDFPQFFVWNSKGRRWTRRKRLRVIGRLVTVSPKEGERYYMRLLLSNVKSPSSFESLRTVNGEVLQNFRDAALRLGFLHSDKYVEETMIEASLVAMPSTLRYLFATVMVFCNPNNPENLFTLIFESLSADYRYQLSGTDASEQYLQSITLEAVDTYLHQMGHSIRSFINLPSIHNNIPRTLHTKETQFECSIIVSEEERRLHLQLNESQKLAYDTIMAAITSNANDSFFIDGPGGSGKTFLYRCLLATVRSNNDIALAVVTSGVAAAILPGGRTAHSRFGIPIDFSKRKNCAISKQSATAKLIADAKLIIWDEAATATKEALEAFDHLLRDIMSNDSMLGGKIVVFGGDFRQTLPVLENTSDDVVIKSSILGTTLWHSLKKIRLTVNMRARLDPYFSEFLLAVGEGSIQNDEQSNIALPPQIVLPYENFEKSFASLVSSVFGDVKQFLLEPYMMLNRCILCPTNESVDEINSILIDQFPGDAVVYTSVDKTVDEQHQGDFEEFLNTLNSNGLPPNKLVLKQGCPVMLLRNLDPVEGLCNGTRLICRELRMKSVHVEIAAGPHVGKRFFLPMIPLNAPDNEKHGIPFSRTQFPIKLCFSMTINKAQGQTLDYVGIYLRQPVFSHGLCYTWLYHGHRL